MATSVMTAENFTELPLTSSPFNDTCAPLQKTYVLMISIFPAFVTAENLFVLLALYLYRRKLKHNNVYLYVASALIANEVTCALAFYHFLNYYYGFESHQPNLWWAFRKGMTLALSLILCGNIGLLIYGIEDSTYIVSKVSKSRQQSDKLAPKYRRRKAIVLICLVWALPTIYALLAITPWNCANRQCTCTLHYEFGSPLCPGGHCSRVYTPMSKTYLLAIVILWALECLALMLLLCKSVYTIRNSLHEAVAKKNNPSKCAGFGRALAKYDASHRVVLLLFALFLFCTIPINVLFILDFVFSDLRYSHVLVNLVAPLPMLYCFASPLLVSHKLSGVKRALFMLTTLSYFKHNTVRRRRNRSLSGRKLSMSRASRDYSYAGPTSV